MENEVNWDEEPNQLPCEGNHKTEGTEYGGMERWIHQTEHDETQEFSWWQGHNICTPDDWRGNQERHKGWTFVEVCEW